MAKNREGILQSLPAHRRRSLIYQRWADLVFLLISVVAVGIVLCPLLDQVQLRVAPFLAPWGLFGGAFVGLVAAVGVWVALQRVGVGLAVVGRRSKWWANPPVWWLGVVAFVFCSSLWHCAIAPQRQDILPYLVQAAGAVLLLGLGRLLAWVVTSVQSTVGVRPREARNAYGETHNLGELADRPEELIEWLKREEPIFHPDEDLFDMRPYARRIADLLRDKPLRTVALIGPYGCGKTGIAKMVRFYLDNKAKPQNCLHPKEDRFPVDDIIAVEVSGWGFREGTIAEHVLDRIVDEIAEHMDCLELVSIPRNYQRMLSGSGGWLGTLCALVGARGNYGKILQKMDNVLLRANMRVVAFLEDVDRNVREETFLNEVAALLEQLKGLENISFVLAIGEKYQGQDIAAKLGERIEIVPPPARQPILRILRSFREYSLKQHPNDIDVLGSEERQGRTRLDASPGLDRFAEAELIRRSIDAVAKLCSSPRILKTSLRSTWFAWEKLHGEVEFDELLICSVLRTAATEVFLLINENIGRLRSLGEQPQTADAKKRDDEIRESLIRQLKERAKDKRWNFDAVCELIQLLFPGLNQNQFLDHAAVNPQSVNVGQPTDYWTRLNREEIAEGEIRDQQILRAIEQWKADSNAQVYQEHTMAEALLQVDGFADKIEQFGQFLDGKQVRDLASELFTRIREGGKIDDAKNCPGFIQLWRISLKSRYEFHENWVAGEISRALPVSLRFASDIYYYWRSDQASHTSPTPELRKRFVDNARSAYGNNAKVFIDALDPDYPWSIYHLVVFHGSRENGGPGLANEDWLWFGPILLASVAVNRQVLLPQISVLLTDHSYNPIAERRGETAHKCDFDDSVAQKVFGQERMRDLMVLLSQDFTTAKPDPEMSSRLACCHGYAKSWLREHRQHG